MKTTTGQGGRGRLGLREHAPADLDALIALTEHREAERRKVLAGVAAALFAPDGRGLSDHERALVSNCLRRLVGDVEGAVRHDLAHRLEWRGAAPARLVSTIAETRVEIAYPRLVERGLQYDVDLIEVVVHRVQGHRLSLAMRRGLGEGVTGSHGEGKLVGALLQQAEAAVSQAVVPYLLAESERLDTFQNPLLRRRDLPPAVAERLHWWTAAALRDDVVRRLGADRARLDDDVESTTEAALARLRGDRGRASEARIVAEQLAQGGKLDTVFATQALREGEVSLFLAAFAELVGLASPIAPRLVYEPCGEALAVACRAMELERATFLEIFELTRLGALSVAPSAPDERDRLDGFYRRLSHDVAAATVAHWRRNPGDLEALRRVGLRPGTTRV